MITNDELKSFVEQGLSAKGYLDSGPKRMPLISSGPAADLSRLRKSPQSIVFLTMGGGPGFSTEQLFDRVNVGARCVGPQGNEEAARQLAADVDSIMTSVVSNKVIGGSLVLWINRALGQPSLLIRDSAERYHFTCTYQMEAMV